MKKLKFINNTSTNYGRGKDKTKRKSRITTALAGVGSAVGGVIGQQVAERTYAKRMYKIFLNNENPTSTNVNSVRKNLLRYKPGTGSGVADAIKKSFNTKRGLGGARGALKGGMLTIGVLGARELYKRYKNRKTVKIGKKTLVYNPPT